MLIWLFWNLLYLYAYVLWFVMFILEFIGKVADVLFNTKYLFDREKVAEKKMKNKGNGERKNERIHFFFSSYRTYGNSQKK